jgi:acyl-CoA synthetase (AMP-forming)/AMP-acid ligase II
MTRYAQRTAVVFGEKRLTYAEMDAKVNQLSHGLLSLGLGRGHKVAALLNNGIESAVSILGIPRAGLTYVALNIRNSPREQAEILNDSETDGLILGEEFAGAMKPFLASIPSLKHVIVVGSSLSGWLSYEELVERQPITLPDVDVDYEMDIERIHYTAGTTGRPKGGVMTFGILYNIITNILINLDKPIGPDDIYLSVGPLTHAAGLMMMVYYCRGAKSIILPRFDPELVLETIERERVTSVLFVPTMLAMILRSPRIKDFDLSSIKRIWYGTAPMPVEWLKEGIKVFGSVFRQNYGMTEMAQPITFLGPEDHVLEGGANQLRRLSSAGKPALGVELKILNENGEAVKPGEIGEICLRSNKMIKEYWKKPQETAETIVNGWLHTRDMGTIDEDGYVYIVDRKHDMIISGGFNIYPREVEEVILTHPAVSEVAVIAVPDDTWGEAVKAMVVLKAGARATEEEIIQLCKENLASYKKPKSVEFIVELPKTAYNKIDRKALREPYWRGYGRRVH